MGRIAAALALMLLAPAFAEPAFAHHSAAVYDFARRGEVDGVVKDIRFMNPHLSLTLVIAGTAGARAVEFEGHSINNFYRVGWRPHMIKVGDRVRVIFAPRKDRAAGGYVTGFVTTNGRVIGFAAPARPALGPLRAQLRLTA